MEIRVLGPVEVVVEGVAVSMGGQKQRTVLALLVVAGGQRVTADQLIAEAYGDEAPDRARRSIHTFISTLRRTFGEMLRSDRRGYVLDVVDESVDARRFEADLRAGRELIDSDPDAASETLRRALAEWRGHAYSDVDVREVLGVEIARLNELRTAAVEVRIEADLARGLHLDLVGELGALIAEHPLRERLRAHHMLALYRSGRQAEALRSYTTARAMLVEELGVEPSPDLQELELRILDQDPDLTVDLRPSIEAMAVVACDATPSTPSMPERERQLTRLHQAFDTAALDAGVRFIDVRGTTIYGVFPSIDRAGDAAQRVARAGGRVALDHGEVDVTDSDVTGPPVTRAARLSAVANVGQVLLSAEAHRALSAGPGEGWTVRSLGHHRLAGTQEPDPIFQLVTPDQQNDFGPLLLNRRPAAAPTQARAPLSGYEMRQLRKTDDVGSVYEAYQPSLGRSVHLRMLPADLVDDPQFIRRFEAEMHRVASIHHPAIVSVLDFWRDPDSAVVVYEPIDASSSFDPSRPDALDVLMTVAEAIARAHERGVVHGGLRSDAITVDEHGNPYVHGLGLAPIVSGSVQLDATAMTAPEAIGEAPTPAADVYALGVLAAEALAGERWHPDQGPPDIDGAVGDIVRACLDPDPAARPPTAGDFIASFTDGLARPMVLKRAARNPYKGLAAFTEVDAIDFFGRTELVDRLVDDVAHHRVTAVAGPSGIGKSSAVKAGVVPRLRSGGASVVVTDMTPGSDPFESLADALSRVAVTVPGPLVRSLADEAVRLGDVVGSVLPVGAELLLVIDQFEEVFTLATGPDADAFLAMLERELHADGGPVRVVLTIRADFLDRPLAHPRFGALIADRTVMVHGPSREELADIITLPAAAVEVQVEPALVEAICDDAAAQPGALPLVEHVLTELFDARTSDTLTVGAYHQAGGLAAAVGRSAEAAYLGLNPDDQTTARAALMGLVSVGEDAADTRRRVRLAQLIRSGLDQASLERVLDAFVKRRLVVLDHDPRTHQPTAEVAHEALISEWDRLRDWLDEAREDLLMARRIESAARDWTASDGDSSFLLRGGRLEQAEAWHARAGEAITDQETDFLAESRRSAAAEAKQRRRNRRRLTTVLATALAITVALAAVANNARTAADRRATENRVAELASTARLTAETDADLSLLLAIEAHELSGQLGQRPSGEVMVALQEAVQETRLVTRVPHGEFVAAFNPDGDTFVADVGPRSSDLAVYSADTFDLLRTVELPVKPGDAAFSPDGSILAVTPEPDGDDADEPGTSVYLVETDGYTEFGRLEGVCCTARPEFSPDGRFITASSAFSTLSWDLTDLDRPPVQWRNDSGGYTSDSSALATIIGTEGSTDVGFYDPVSGELLDQKTLPVPRILGLDLHPTRDLMLVNGQLWEFDGLSPQLDLGLANEPRGVFASSGDRVALVNDSREMVVAGLDGSGRIRLPAPVHVLSDDAFSPDGRLVAVVTALGETSIWDTSTSGPRALRNIESSATTALQMYVSPDGLNLSTVEAAGSVATVRRYDFDTGQLAAQSGGFWAVPWLPAVSPSGLYAAGANDPESGRIEELDTRTIIYEEPCVSPSGIHDSGDFSLNRRTCGARFQGATVRVSDGKTLWADFYPIAFGPAGTPSEGLIAEGWTGGVGLRRLPDGNFINDPGALLPPPGGMGPPRFSPDGGLILMGSDDNGGWVVDVAAFAGGAMGLDIVATVLAEGEFVNTVAAGPNVFATAHADAIRTWDRATNELWFELPVDGSVVPDVAISPDGSTLMYLDADGVIKRMLLNPDELVAFARSRVTRDFTEQECERYSIAEDCSVYATAVDDDPGA